MDVFVCFRMSAHFCGTHLGPLLLDILTFRYLMIVIVMVMHMVKVLL